MPGLPELAGIEKSELPANPVPRRVEHGGGAIVHSSELDGNAVPPCQNLVGELHGNEIRQQFPVEMHAKNPLEMVKTSGEMPSEISSQRPPNTNPSPAIPAEQDTHTATQDRHKVGTVISAFGTETPEELAEEKRILDREIEAT